MNINRNNNEYSRKTNVLFSTACAGSTVVDLNLLKMFIVHECMAKFSLKTSLTIAKYIGIHCTVLQYGNQLNGRNETGKYSSSSQSVLCYR